MKAYTLRILRRPKVCEFLALQVTVKICAKYCRKHRSLGNTNYLSVVSRTNLISSECHRDTHVTSNYLDYIFTDVFLE